jgi:Flp pilus assembly pilin Flp
MFHLLSIAQQLFRKQEGASLPEVALLLALLVIICVAAMNVIGTKISTMFLTVLTSV